MNIDIVVPIIFGVALVCCGIYFCILFVQECKTLKILKKKNNKKEKMIQKHNNEVVNFSNSRIRKYRKKPVVIEAIQYQFYNKDEIDKFVGAQFGEYTREISYNTFDTYLIIPTLEGNMEASIGDYIIKGVNGEFYPCKPDIFEKTYELAD